MLIKGLLIGPFLDLKIALFCHPLYDKQHETHGLRTALSAQLTYKHRPLFSLAFGAVSILYFRDLP